MKFFSVVVVLLSTLFSALALSGESGPSEQPVSSEKKSTSTENPTGSHGSASQAPATANHAQVAFARVNGETISLSEYMMALREQSRTRFYHGKPAESQLKSFGQEVADQLVDRELLLQEAARRNITVTADKLDREVLALKQRYPAAASRQSADSAVFWSALRERLKQEMVLKQLKSSVEDSVQVDQQAIQAYYQQHPDKFTEPEKQHLELILLGVDPSSNSATWNAAKEEASAIKAKIESGGSFADLASLHSSDNSADKGGDLGFVHYGVLGKELQQKLDAMPLNTVSEPIRTLEGFAIFRVRARKPAVLHSFEHVAERAGQLALRDAREAAIKNLAAGLREQASIEMNDEYIGQVNLVAR